tara:strand:+ start:347 stop:589 length:243 start_codon:yes stop_codon:yes gene_type:complete
MERNEIVLYVKEEVKRLWQLESRPDLEKDCVDFILNQWGEHEDNDYLAYLVVKFLSTLCGDAVSSEDLEFQYQQSLGEKI